MPKFRKVIVRSPASTANLGPGFDVFGMALEHPYDKVTIKLTQSNKVEIEVHGVSSNTIPCDPFRNTAGVVAGQMLKEFGLNLGVSIKIEKGVPPGVGLGSSAASAAAVAFGLNELLGLQLDHKDLIRFSAKGEVASAGSEHADNVSAAVCGDFVIIRSYDPIDVIHLKAPPNLGVCVAIPKIQTLPKKTEKARAVLPVEVPMKKVIHNVGHAAAMAVGFALGDVKLIGRSMHDVVVEPARASMIPGYQIVKDAAIKAGACGATVSGAGPSIIAVVDENDHTSESVMEAMKKGFRKVGVDAEVFSTKPGKGVSLIWAK
ncbi:homoserine kinase [Candidatus Bathyarchaeota archaeon]|nr:homoserine kinase [Candidatus Bathyarchaeota archaeon]